MNNKRPWLMGCLAAMAVVASGCSTVSGATPAAAATTGATVADVLAAQPQLSTFTRLVRQAGLDQTLAGEGPYTVFAPTDEAFQALPAETLNALGQDPVKLKALLSYHIVAAQVVSTSVKNAKLKSLEGAELATSRAGDFVLIDEALVTRADIGTRNGVVDVIDRVLTPPKR